MRRMTYFVMALALVLGFTQCKKEQTNENNNTDEGEKVTITLNVDNGFSKGHVTPGENTAPVVYDNEDIIMVGYDGAYVGDLTYNGIAFTGSLSILRNGDQPLHFYYLGGLSWTVTNDQCTVDINDQRSRLGIISYGTSTDDFVGEGTYSAYLRNQCALVKFELGSDVGSATIATTTENMKTKATINFKENVVTTSNETEDITTFGTGGTRYAIVLIGQGATDVTLSGSTYSGNFHIPAVSYNDFVTVTKL